MRASDGVLVSVVVCVTGGLYAAAGGRPAVGARPGRLPFLVPEQLREPRRVAAVTDCWFAYLLPELLREYPDAKVVLGTRPTGPWLRSYENYIATSHLRRAVS